MLLFNNHFRFSLFLLSGFIFSFSHKHIVKVYLNFSPSFANFSLFYCLDILRRPNTLKYFYKSVVLVFLKKVLFSSFYLEVYKLIFLSLSDGKMATRIIHFH